MATLSEVMRYALDLDVKGFTSGLKDAEGEAKETFDDIEDAGEQTSSRFSGIGGKMGTALVAGFAAVGAGALIAKGISQAMDAQAGVNRLQGQFAFTAEEAGRYGDLAGDLYAEGWGEGVTEVQQVVGLAAKKLGTTTETELRNISEQVLAVSKTWGEDFDAVIRSTDQLIQNDLAANAEEALDLIVAAFQNGGNEAGDLLDTIDEYSQHWAAMGLSGEDALNQIIHGFQNGQRDADKMADAVKEMRLRVTDDSDAISEAYDSLNLNADQLRRKFLEGGESAREAFLTVIEALRNVEDPIERNRLAVELIGTQFEDLGPTALDSLAAVDGALDDTTGKAAALSETVEATDWEQFKRRGEQALTPIGEAVLFLGNDFLAFQEKVGNAGDSFGEFLGISKNWEAQLTDDIESVNAFMSEFDDTMLDGLSTFDDVHAAIIDQADAVLSDNDALRAANELTNEWAKENENAKGKADALGASLGTLDWELKQIHGQTVTATGDIKAAGEAADWSGRQIDDLEAEFRGLRLEIANRSSYRDLEAQFDTVKTSAIEAFTAASEGAEDADVKARAHGQAVDDLRLKVLDFGESIGGLPASSMTWIQTQIDEGNFAAAEARLAALSRARDIVLRARVTGGGTVMPNGGPRARGGPTIAGIHEVAEQGPELLHDNGRTYLLSGGGGFVEPLSGAARSGGGSGAGVNLTVNVAPFAGGPETGRVVVDALERFYRSGGRPPRSQ